MYYSRMGAYVSDPPRGVGKERQGAEVGQDSIQRAFQNGQIEGKRAGRHEAFTEASADVKGIIPIILEKLKDSKEADDLVEAISDLAEQIASKP